MLKSSVIETGKITVFAKRVFPQGGVLTPLRWRMIYETYSNSGCMYLYVQAYADYIAIMAIDRCTTVRVRRIQLALDMLIE